MRHLLLMLALLLPAGAWAQTPGVFVPNTPLSAAALNTALGLKADAAALAAKADNSITATGSTTPRMLADWFQGLDKDGSLFKFSQFSVGGTPAVTGFGTGIGQALGPLINRSGNPSLELVGRLIINQSAPNVSNFADVHFRHDGTAVVGGTSAAINKTIMVDQTVGPSDGAQNWALTSSLHSNSTVGGLGVAAYSQAVRNAGSNGWMWSFISEVRDETGLSSSAVGNPTLSQEVDLTTTGVDDAVNPAKFGGFGNRHLTHYVVNRFTGSANNEITHGLWFGTSNSYIDSLIGFDIGGTGGAQVRQVIDTRGAIPPTGVSDPVAAVRMTAGQVIDFNGGPALNSVPGATLKYDTGSSAIVSSAKFDAPVLATGATTPRTLADRAAERINVRDFGAICDNVADDRNAFAAAITRVNTLNSTGHPSVIYIPPGVCRIKGTNGALPQFQTGTNGGVIGSGVYKTSVIMDVTYTGDLFSWSEAWGPAIFDLTTIGAGPLVRDITIQGNRAAASAQYALHFYDRTDLAVIENVTVYNVKGGCFSSGTPKNIAATGWLRESALHNIHCTNSADTTIPAVEFYSAGLIGGNPANITDINIYGSHGPSFVIRNDAATGISNYKIRGLRIEGTEGNPDSVAADLLNIGSATSTGAQIHDIDIDQLQLTSPYAGWCAMRITSQDSASKPYYITVRGGGIGAGGGTGKGLCIDAGRDMNLSFPAGIGTTDTNVTIASTAKVGANITIDGNGTESSWTWSVDATAIGLPRSIMYKTGVQSSNVMSLAATLHDGSALGGNAIGPTAIDLQTTRGNATQVASGNNATIAGGSSNTASALASTIAGGQLNLLTGQFSAIPGGTRATDGGRIGLWAFANGRNAANGDAQATAAVLFGTGATAAAFRLTSGGAAAGATNCFNLTSAGMAYGFSIRLHGRDNTTPGTDYDWFVPNAMMTRDTNVASTALALGTPVILSRGTITGAAVVATADTTNGCLSLTFAPPTGNTDTWHAVARVDAVEVQ